MGGGRHQKSAAKMVKIGRPGASWGLLVGIFWCAHKNRAIQPKRQAQRPTFRPSQEQKPFEDRVAQEDRIQKPIRFRIFSAPPTCNPHFPSSEACVCTAPPKRQQLSWPIRGGDMGVEKWGVGSTKNQHQKWSKSAIQARPGAFSWVFSGAHIKIVPYSPNDRPRDPLLDPLRSKNRWKMEWLNKT